MEKIENLSAQNTVVTVAYLKHQRIDLISLSTTAKYVVDMRTEDENIINIGVHNKDTSDGSTFISWTSVIPALIWLLMLLDWLEPLFWCHKDKKTKKKPRDGAVDNRNT